MFAVPDGLTFRQDYFGDPPAWVALVGLLHDTFGIDVGILDRLGGPDPTSMPFAYFDDDGTCVANFTTFSVPVMLDGRRIRAVGFQSGAVRPEWRGRGLYRDLMTRAFDWCDKQGFDMGLPLTDKPALYEPYGFGILPQHRFTGAPPVVKTIGASSRRLSLDNAGDVDLAIRLLRERTPVSQVFSVAAQTEMFLLNTTFDPDIRLDHIEALEAIVAWKYDGSAFQLLDIVAPEIPPLATLLKALAIAPDRVDVFFSLDALDWQGAPEPVVSGTHLMARGAMAGGVNRPFMLSPMAEF